MCRTLSGTNERATIFQKKKKNTSILLLIFAEKKTVPLPCQLLEFASFCAQTNGDYYFTLFYYRTVMLIRRHILSNFCRFWPKIFPLTSIPVRYLVLSIYIFAVPSSSRIKKQNKKIAERKTVLVSWWCFSLVRCYLRFSSPIYQQQNKSNKKKTRILVNIKSTLLKRIVEFCLVVIEARLFFFSRTLFLSLFFYFFSCLLVVQRLHPKEQHTFLKI